MATQGPQFDGFLGGWLGAEDRRQQVAERDRQNAAYNALFETYGAVAGDPVAYGQLEGIRRSNAREPLELQGLELGNEAARTGIDQSNALFPETLRGAQLGNVQTGQNISQDAAAFPLEQGQRQANLTGTGLQNQGMAETLGDNRVARSRAALANGVRLLKATRDNGGDLGVAFDRLLPAMQDMGIPQAEIMQAKDLVMARPETLDDIAAALMDQDPKGAKAAAEKPSAADEYYDRTLGKEAAAAEAAVYDRISANERTVIKADAAGAEINAMVDDLLLPDNLEDAFGWSSIAATINETDYNAAAAKLQSLKNKIQLDMMTMLKEASKTGATGFGSLTEKEGALLQGALGELDPKLSPEAAEEALIKVKERMAVIVKQARELAATDNDGAKRKAEKLFERLDERAGRGGKKPAAGAATSLPSPADIGAEEGDEATGPDGTVYVVRNGKLEPK